MTEAIRYILIVLAVLLFVHVFWLALLLRQKKQSSKKNSSAYDQDYLIVYASQSGNAAELARQTAEKFNQFQISNRIVDLQVLDVEELQHAKKVLWMVSTYGDGDAPDSARIFIKNIMSKSLDLSQQKFAILALGDRHYAHFCQFGIRLESWLTQNKAQSMFEMVRVDQLSSEDLATWKNHLEHEIDVSLADFSDISSAPWSCLKLIERECLNQGSQGNPLYRLRFSVPETLEWKSGDILEVQCANSFDRIQNFLSQYQKEIETLDSSFDLSVLKFKNLNLLPNRLAHETVLEWISRFEILDDREYSISTIVSMGFLELVVRQEMTNGQLGLGSGWLTAYSEMGEEIQARIRTNPTFHFDDQIHPNIFIGNGSGIAGLKSHLHQCHKLDFNDNWLIYGERQAEFDRGFVDQLQTWKKQGTLTDLDLVYSRDGNQLKYVTDCLYEKQDQLKIWIERGAVIYVCGSLKGMAQDVDNALNEILGEKVVEQLMLEKRYLRDVY